MGIMQKGFPYIFLTDLDEVEEVSPNDLDINTHPKP